MNGRDAGYKPVVGKVVDNPFASENRIDLLTDDAILSIIGLHYEKRIVG